jgi:plastocyanin
VKRRMTVLLGTGLALGIAAPASAAEVAVRGLDTEAFDKPEVSIELGDTVKWTFDAGLPHDVTPTSANWAPWHTATKPAPPVEFKFDAVGTYTYVCSVHSTTMRGTVTVGNPPPPPPPPLSEQPFPSDSSLAGIELETGGLDVEQPRLRSVAAKRSGKRVRVSFRVNEQSVVTVRLKRGRKVVKTKKASTASRGSVTVAGLKPGRYAVQVRATDPAGNVSSLRRASFRVS